MILKWNRHCNQKPSNPHPDRPDPTLPEPNPAPYPQEPDNEPPPIKA